jgi:hypothetical protein
MGETQAATIAPDSEQARVKHRRGRTAVTSGRKLFVEGDPNSAWSRRYRDLVRATFPTPAAGRRRS